MPQKSRQPRRKSPAATATRLKAALKTRLKGARKPALLAVGSDLRADDAAGLLVAGHLKNLSPPLGRRLKVFLGDTAPENLTGPIKRYAPSHLIVVDSAESGAATGAVSVMDVSDAIGGTTFSTHYLPLTIMLRYILESIDCEVIIIGIQPASLMFGAATSKAVEKSAARVAAAIHEALG